MLGKILKNLNKDNMESISGMDAAFLYVETDTSPMHIGSVAVIEGDLKFEKFRKTILSRIHLIPKLRQRLVYVPMSIDYPYWVDDPNFDIDMHLSHIALPRPGAWSQLRAAAARIFSEPLDQSRPLWSFTFVEGLDNIPQVPTGSVAIISKVHHVAIDGVAGAGILSLLFDFTPENKPIPEPKPYQPAPLPNELSMILKSTLTFAEKPLKFPKLLSEAFTASFKAGMLTRVKRIDLPTAPFTAPPTPLNGIISPKRKWNTAILSLDRVKALKKLMDTTLNDVVLAICAGALRRYLLEKNQLPHKPLVAMVPISTRTQEEEEQGGNQISSMLVQLATNVEDPIERLEVIHENTIRGKTYQGAIGAKTLANMAEVVPFGVANQAARLYSRFKISEMHNPVFNVTITNVPGPQFPLYLNGHKLLSIMGMAPIIDGMGLIITVFSYNGLITLSPTSDVKSMPDLDVFSRYLRESANELEAAILNFDKTKKKTKKKRPSKKPESDRLFSHIRKQLKANAKFISAGNGVFEFQVIRPESDPVFWKIDLDKSPGTVRKAKAPKADAKFSVKEEHLMRIARGELNIQTAFIQGRLKIDGKSAKAMKFGTILSKLPKMK
ncbi:MAG: wax ester/triacylglycerol synthase family O-acyltransferase [Bacteroidota bacterium]